MILHDLLINQPVQTVNVSCRYNYPEFDHFGFLYDYASTPWIMSQL